MKSWQLQLQSFSIKTPLVYLDKSPYPITKILKKKCENGNMDPMLSLGVQNVFLSEKPTKTVKLHSKPYSTFLKYCDDEVTLSFVLTPSVFKRP